jgi:endonuclease/exonuclease/phosphatase (EEP) superfamily protein YafD
VVSAGIGLFGAVAFRRRPGGPPPRRYRHAVRGAWPLAATGGLVLATGVALVLRPSGSPAAALVTLAPFLLGAAAVLALVAAVTTRTPRARVVGVLLALLLAAGLAAPPALAGADRSAVPAEDDLVLLSWNTHGVAQAALAREAAAVEPDVAVLIETNGWEVERNRALVARFPHRWASPRDGAVPGLVLLSRWPVEPGGSLGRRSDLWDRRRVAWATVRTPDGPVVVVLIHAANPLGDGAWRYAQRRDRQLAATCALLHDLGAAGDPVVIAGDFNVTGREKAWDCLDAWGTDAWEAAGAGRGGATWRPSTWGRLPALLRIDHVVASEGIVAVRQDVRCHVGGSDHCPVVTSLRVGGGRGS